MSEFCECGGGTIRGLGSVGRDSICDCIGDD